MPRGLTVGIRPGARPDCPPARGVRTFDAALAQRASRRRADGDSSGRRARCRRGPSTPPAAFGRVGSGRARDRLGPRRRRHRVCRGLPRGRPRRGRRARARGRPDARRRRGGRRAPTCGCTPATRCPSSPSGSPTTRSRRCTCSSPTRGRRRSTRSGGSCSSTNLDLLARGCGPADVLRIATDQDAYADHARAQLARHPRWEVAGGQRPDWRPDDGFEAKGCARRPHGHRAAPGPGLSSPATAPPLQHTEQSTTLHGTPREVDDSSVCCRNDLVGATGFEPATFRSQSGRATKLRHAPSCSAVPVAAVRDTRTPAGRVDFGFRDANQ